MILDTEVRDFTVLTGIHEYGVRELTVAASGLDATGDCLIAIYVPDGPLTAAAVLFVERRKLDAMLLHAETPRAQAEAWAGAAGCSHLLTGLANGSNLRFNLEVCGARKEKREPGPARITLLTSGTTGEPKRITHDWESLRASVARRPTLQRARWMSLYPLSRFAGFNALLHATYNDGTLIVPVSLRPYSIIEEIKRRGPTHVVGTPTLWRSLLMALPTGSSALKSVRQITLGGEVVDQQILNALACAVPHARLTHIYASTELGVCVTVSDRLAGFPREWLDKADKATQLKVRDGQLWIKRNKPPSSKAPGDQDDWVATGDMAEIKGGRVFVKGRCSDILNIGGGKVVPAEVEERLLEVPGVVAARVTGRGNSISGTIVAAEIVGTSGIDERALRRSLILHCRTCLPAFAVPRLISFVNSLPATASGKLSRHFGVDP